MPVVRTTAASRRPCHSSDEAHDPLEPAHPDRIEQAQRPECLDVARVVVDQLERGLDVRLHTEAAHRRRAHRRDDVHEVRRVRVRQGAVVGKLELRVVT